MPHDEASPPESDPQGSAGNLSSSKAKDQGAVKPTCPICNQSFTPPYNHPSAATCSQKCAAKAYRQRQAAKRRKKPPPPPVTLTCQQCGNTFTRPATARRAKYCSRSCANQAAYQRKKTAEPEPTTAACDHCDQPFTYQRKAQPRRYCSKRCADAAFKQRQQSQPSETPPDPPAPAIHLPWGHYLGPDTGATTVPPLECAICGRPKEGDATGWRVRAYRTSPRYDYLLLSICPVHYRPGEPAPHLYGEGTHWG